MCKTSGESQFTPPGFQSREITGLDGKIYKCTGVSHDAIWVDGVQVDLIAKANDSHTPINIVAEPVWNEIPQMYWRPNNPPLKDSVVPPPVPPPTPFPGYEDLGGDAFFRANVGVPLEADMAMVGQPLNNGSSVWFSRTIYSIVAAYLKSTVKPTPGQINQIIKNHRNEWRAILGLPPI